MASNTLMPNHFQGLSSEGAERWWEDVEHWCAFKNLTEEEKVVLLPLLLKGDLDNGTVLCWSGRRILSFILKRHFSTTTREGTKSGGATWQRFGRQCKFKDNL